MKRAKGRSTPKAGRKDRRAAVRATESSRKMPPTHTKAGKRWAQRVLLDGRFSDAKRKEARRILAWHSPVAAQLNQHRGKGPFRMAADAMREESEPGTVAGGGRPSTTLKLGSNATDKVTGFRGTLTGYAVYMHGESSVLLEGRDSTGRPISEWVSIARIAGAQ